MFKKAERKNVPYKAILVGPSGSGKTESALRMMRGLVGPEGRIAVIDTENDSASLYSDRYEFDVALLHPPFTGEKYRQALEAAEKAGYNGVIIDSISHQWAGEGGLLEVKGKLDASGKGNGYTNWNTITPKHEQFKNDILYSPIHVLCTVRAKQGYILVENSKGKQEPKKVGMEPIQRDNLEYEFTTVFDVDMNHTATVSKDRTNLFKDGPFQITEETGAHILNWLKGGAATELPKDHLNQTKIPPQINHNLTKKYHISTKVGRAKSTPFLENVADVSQSRFTFGKFANKPWIDLDAKELCDYVEQMETDAVKNDRPVPEWFGKVKIALEKYINEIGEALPPDPPTPELPNEPVPF